MPIFLSVLAPTYTSLAKMVCISQPIPYSHYLYRLSNECLSSSSACDFMFIDETTRAWDPQITTMKPDSMKYTSDTGTHIEYIEIKNTQYLLKGNNNN